MPKNATVCCPVMPAAMAVNIVWPSSNTIDACVRNGIEPFNFTASLQKLNTFPA